MAKLFQSLLLIALIGSPYVLKADSINGTANDVLSFRPAPAARGPASAVEEAPATIEPEIADDSTEAGISCVECMFAKKSWSNSLDIQISRFRLITNFTQSPNK